MKASCQVVLALLGLTALGVTNVASGAMVDRWTLNEGSGTDVFSNGSLATPMRVLNLGSNTNWVSTPGGTGMQFSGGGGSVIADTRFVGTYGYVDEDYGSTFTAQTIEAWIKPDAGALSGWHTIVAKAGSTVGIYMTLLNGQPGNYPGPYAPALSADTWYHVVHTADATAERVYINGVEVAVASSDWVPESDHLSAPNKYLTIGTVDYATEPFVGVIDEVRIHDNVLSAAQVLASYQAGPVPEPAALSLLGLGALAMLRRRK